MEQCDIDESDLQCFWECHLWNVNVDESVSGLEMGELPFSSGTLSSIRRDLVLMPGNHDLSISSLEKERGVFPIVRRVEGISLACPFSSRTTKGFFSFWLAV